MSSIIIMFFIFFISILIYLFSLKTLNTYFQNTLQKQKTYYTENYPVSENEVDYTPQLNYINKMAFSFLVLSAILFFTLNKLVNIYFP